MPVNMPSNILKALLCLSPLLALGEAMVVDFTKGNVTAAEFLADPSLVSSGTVERRQDDTCTQISYLNSYEIVGDGNPHQNFKITELGGTMIGCPGSVSKGYAHTTGWSINGGFNPGPEKYDFASLGFSVSESTTISTTETFTCDVNWDDMCILNYQAVTAVTVDFVVKAINCQGVVSVDRPGRGVVLLPNANSETSGGSVIRRGVNSKVGDRKQCRGGSSDREIDFFCGPPGGPEWFTTQENGPSGAYLDQRAPADCEIPIEAYDWT